MQSNFRLFLALQRDIWFIDPAYAEAQLPMLERLLSGQGPGAWQDDDDDEDDDQGGCYAVQAQGATPFRASRYNSYNDAPTGSIAVFPVSGPILKYGYCGDTGSMALAQLLLEAASHPNIIGGVMEIDSPGGQVEGLATVHDAQAIFRAAGKPLDGVVRDGMGASAAYYLGAGCDELHVTHATSRVGSIGVVATLTDNSEQDKASGRKRITVYATRSVDKNKDIRDALAGDTKALIKELDVHAEDFFAVVKEGRGDRLNPAAGDPFTGKMYFAAEAQELGLIDGIMSFADVVAHVHEKATAGPSAAVTVPPVVAQEAPATPNDTPNSNLNTTMHTRLLALLGLTMALEATKDGTHLQPTHLDAIEGALEAKEKADKDLAAAQLAATNHAKDLQAVTDRATKAEEDLAKRAGRAITPETPKQEGNDRQTPQAEETEIDPEIQAILDMKAEAGIPNELPAK